MGKVLFALLFLMMLFTGFTESSGTAPEVITWSERVVILSLEENCTISKKCIYVLGFESGSEYIIPRKSFEGLIVGQQLMAVTEARGSLAGILFTRSLL